jgi:hypothetical protein
MFGVVSCASAGEQAIIRARMEAAGRAWRIGYS